MDEFWGIEKARAKFGDLIDRVRYDGQHFIITRHGKAAAAIVPVNWLAEARAALSEKADANDR